LVHLASSIAILTSYVSLKGGRIMENRPMSESNVRGDPILRWSIGAMLEKLEALKQQIITGEIVVEVPGE